MSPDEAFRRAESEEQFRTRLTQDAFNDATAAYWRRRAATFEWARPRQGDFQGQATDEEYAALDARICRTRDICLARAAECEGRPEERVA